MVEGAVLHHEDHDRVERGVAGSRQSARSVRAVRVRSCFGIGTDANGGESSCQCENASASKIDHADLHAAAGKVYSAQKSWQAVVAMAGPTQMAKSGALDGETQ